MAEALLCISVLQNMTSLFDQVFRILRRLRRAYDSQKTLVDVLNRHKIELKSMQTIMEIIEVEEELQIAAVRIELARVQDVQIKLKEILVSFEPDAKGRMNQIARQFVKGSADEKKLTVIMNELGAVKQSLLLRIQVAQVGVMRNMRKELVANAAVIQRIDESLRGQVSDWEGLRIARLLKDRNMAEDGTVIISVEELTAVTRIESDSSSDDGTLVDESEMPLRNLPEKDGRDVHHNKAKGESVQINAAVEKDLWKDLSRVSIRHNLSEDRAVQVNHANPLEVMEFFRSWQKENIARSRQEALEGVVRVQH